MNAAPEGHQSGKAMSTELTTTEANAKNRWPQRIVVVLVFAVVVPVGASVLYTYSPTTHTFYPSCMFRYLTNLHCPGCGATRSLYSLLHGNVEQAIAYNVLFVLLTPLIFYAIFRLAVSTWTGRPAPGPKVPERVSKALLYLLLVFWVARNIDVYPLNLLAPHPLVQNDPPELPPAPKP